MKKTTWAIENIQHKHFDLWLNCVDKTNKKNTYEKEIATAIYAYVLDSVSLYAEACRRHTMHVSQYL